MPLFLSLPDQTLGGLSDILGKHDSQKFAIITGMEREVMTNIISLYKGN